MDGLEFDASKIKHFPTKKKNFSSKPGRVSHERGENVPGGQRHEHPPVEDVLEGLEGLLQLDRHQVGQEGGSETRPKYFFGRVLKTSYFAHNFFLKYQKVSFHTFVHKFQRIMDG